MQYSFTFLIILFAGIINSSYAQEKQIGLTSNAILSNKPIMLKTTPKPQYLPFIDDFSDSPNSLNSNRWSDHKVLVNSHFAQGMPSVGIATFDILDSLGHIYPNAGVFPFYADTLTSQPINCKYAYDSIAGASLYIEITSGVYDSAVKYLKYTNKVGKLSKLDSANYYYKTDATLYVTSDSIFNGQLFKKSGTDYNPFPLTYKLSDSIYFSFFYSSKGLADNPDESDSLILQFYDPTSNVWNNIWKASGTEQVEFTRVFIPITNQNYLNSKFRFRFMNMATITAEIAVPGKRTNCDLWHIDYVMIKPFSSQSDTILNDICFTNALESFLYTYQAIPWKHFQTPTAFSSLRKPFIPFNHTSWYNLNIQVANRHIRFYNNDGGQLYFKNALNINSSAFQSIIDTVEFDYDFADDNDADSMEINIQLNFSPASFDLVRSNDTIRKKQIFFNYYAYDDGSAEAGYGLEGSGLKKGEVALRFNPYLEDSLRAVDFYFNESFEASLADGKYSIAIWDDNNGAPGNLVKELTVLKPYYWGINNFVRFMLDEPLFVDDIFYIGWIQYNDKFLNVGFDLNTTSSNQLYYRTSNTWISSKAKGNIMIRPIVDEKAFTSTRETSILEPSVKIYPNPVNDYLRISNTPKEFRFELINLQGKTMISGINENSIPVYSLPAGMYLLRLQSNDEYLGSFKVIIKH